MTVRTFGPAAFCLAFAAAAAGGPPPSGPAKPLPRAHAHNDYEHPRPLLDALDNGFCSVEADIYLVDGKLLVAHNRKDVTPARTLEALYLDPLRERSRANGGPIHPGVPTFSLLIDVKSEAKATYAALDKVLAGYADLLTVTRDGKPEPKAVTVVLSGGRDTETIAGQAVRYVGIDGRTQDLEANPPADRVPWVSASWAPLFRWRGDGPMPDDERKKLRDYVETAHRQGRVVRFWATPETEAVWKELHAAGVDLIGTDKLAELRAFLAATPGGATR